MDSCSLVKTGRFQTKKDQSGVSTVNLVATMQEFDSKYGKDPELDQIPGADSSKYLLEQIGNSTKKILEYTNSETIEEAQIKLNNQFRDLNIKLLPCGETTIVDIKHRASVYNKVNDKPVEVNPDVTKQQGSAAIVSMLQKLQKQYGININYLSQDELNEKFGKIIPDLNLVNGFVYQGDIYINTDIAKINSPIHELLHIFLGGMRFQDPVLYESIVNSIEKLKNYKGLAKPFIGHRTRLDINEEIFIDQFSKYLTNQFNSISKMSQSTIDQIFYNVNRILDSTLAGNYSVNSVNPNQLYNMNILELSQMVQSEAFVPNYTGSINDAMTHRTIANLKEQMLNDKSLIEECN